MFKFIEKNLEMSQKLYEMKRGFINLNKKEEKPSVRKAMLIR